MRKVRILDRRIPKRIGEVGEVVDLPDRYAARWIRRGLVEDADVPEPERAAAVEEAAELDEVSYHELRSMAAELPEDHKPASQKKDDLLRALKADTYRRRDIRAEE